MARLCKKITKNLEIGLKPAIDHAPTFPFLPTNEPYHLDLYTESVSIFHVHCWDRKRLIGWGHAIQGGEV
jgi:hypothetical protein